MVGHDECREYMRIGKRHLHAGNLKKAQLCFLCALELANDNESAYAAQRGIITHRLAVVAAKMGDDFVAERRFQRALDYIENNPIGRAICLRDYGNFELLRGNHKKARRLSAEALGNLEHAHAEPKPKRLAIEKAVTEGFIARVDFEEGVDVASAVACLQELALLLRHYSRKPAYELANLLWLIEILPSGDQRDTYIARARELSGDIGNTYVWGELRSLSIGEPMRDVYRLTVKIASFGVKTLKGAVRIIR